MRLAFLRKKLTRLEAKLRKLDERCKAATDAAEVRSLTDELEDLNAEIEETRSEIQMEEEAEKRAKEQNKADDTAGDVPESRQQPPVGAVRHNADIVGSYAQKGAQGVSERSDDDPTCSMEYRMAYKAYVQRGVPIPAEMRQRVDNYINSLPREVRAGFDAINTGDTGVVIPMNLVREVINTIRKRYGNLYSRVRKLSLPGGVKFPVGALEATASWITESTVAPRQDIGDVDAVIFSYNMLEMRIAQTFLSSILSIEEFEMKVPEVIATAYLKAMDTAIMKGTGVDQPLGILNDTRVTTAVGHTIALTAAEINNWTAWRKKFFSKLPLGYRSGEFIFNNGTVDAYLETMADGNNNPIFRQATGLEVNDGDAADPNGRFFGRRISLVEPDILADYDTASSSDVIGVYWQPEDYGINENYGFMTRRYYDEERNQWVNKALTVTDAKILNPKGYYLITKA